VELVKADIQTGIKRVDAQVQNGVAFKSSLNMLKAEQLKSGTTIYRSKGIQKGFGGCAGFIYRCRR
jgi:hypothetical protein